MILATTMRGPERSCYVPLQLNVSAQSSAVSDPPADPQAGTGWAPQFEPEMPGSTSL
jgi:hypothetical protein